MNTKTNSDTLKKVSYLIAGISASLIMAACGGPRPKAVKSSEVKVTETPVKPVEAAQGRMAIPFEIATQAALEGHEDTVIQALETGTDPNQIDENGRTLLMLTAFNGHTSILERLINEGAKLDTQDMAGRTALMYASTGKNLPTVSLLLDHKAKVNLVDGGEHWSAIMFAAAEGNKEVVELLLQHEADISLMDIDDETAESFARDNGHLELADLLKKLAEEQ